MKDEKNETKLTEELDDLVQDTESIDKDEYIAKLNDHLSEQRKKADEYFEHLKRNMAEFDNFKKRMLKEKEGLYTTITSDIIADLLPVMDNFEKAVLAECKDELYKNGMQMIKFGLVEIEAINEDFDPNFHEAVMHVEDDSVGEKKVVEVLRKGYKIGQKVIRHSMVKVAN